MGPGGLEKEHNSKTRDKIEKTDGLCLRASDLVMKVDALLSSLPKANARLELNFAEERYRYRKRLIQREKHNSCCERNSLLC